MNERNGQKVVNFAERYCHVPSGKGAGKLVKLRPWQRDLFVDLTASGARRAYIQMPRKNGKSYLAAVLGLFGLVADQEPSALVVSAAADREQARLVFGTARRIVEMSPVLSRQVAVYRNELVVKKTDSRYRVLSADAHTKEGLNVSLAVVDELHAHPNRDLYDVLSLSTGAREHPLILAITTPGNRYDRFGHDTIAYQLYTYGRRIESGEVVDPDFFFRSWEPSDPSCSPADRGAWAEANPALGDFLHVADLEAAARVTPEAEFKTKRLGLWTTSSEAWLPHGAWDACADGQPEPAQGTRVVLALDGSFSGDATALVGATVEPNPRMFVVAVWEKPMTAGASWRVDVADVEDAVLQACKMYSVDEVVCDPYRWQWSMQNLESQGAPIVEYPQGNSRMIPAAQKVFEAVTRGLLRHDGNQVLARHIASCHVKATPLGPKIVKDHKDSQRRIDAAVAAVMAYDRAQTLGNMPPPSFKVW